MAITASFNNGTLSIAGDDTQNLIMVSRDVAGTILVNGGALAITGGPATIGNTSLIEVSALGDIDTIQFDDANGALPAATINGGDGADSIVGRGEPDVIIGGRGNDLALMGAGDDRFIWNPGDGSDVVEGQSGSDTLQFNGANIAEKIDISANGGRVRFTRDVATITMDVNGVEHITYNALGGADTVTVNDLTGTDVANVTIDLASPAGSGTGDGAADLVSIKGGSAGNSFSIASDSAGTITVGGLATQVTALGFEAANDHLVVHGEGGIDTGIVSGTSADDTFDIAAIGGLVHVARTTPLAFAVDIGTTESIVIAAGDGDDTITAGPGLASLTTLTLDGGSGNDSITGGDAPDILIGSRGADKLDGGAGDDRFIYHPGDGADQIFNFVAGTGTDDKVDLRAVPSVHSFAQLQTFISQSGGNTLIDFGNGDSITLSGVLPDSLSADDFLFDVAPIAQDGSAAGNEDKTITGTLAAIDPDSPSLIYSRVTQAAHGTVTVNGDGTFSYIPDPNFNGSDSFTFKANDGFVDSNIATVNLTVAPVDDAPTDITLSHANVSEASPNATVVGAFTGTDPDLGDTFTYSLLDDAAGRFAVSGTNLIVANGILLDFEQSTSHAITVRETDSGGLTFDKVFMISVTDLNPEAVLGTSADDFLVGGFGNDSINGADGNDAILGGGGDDIIGGGSGNDVLLGQDGNDQLFGESGNDSMAGNAGNDTIVGMDGHDTIGGDDGNDVINSGGGSDLVFGGNGNDQIGGGAGDDVLLGMTGNDTIFGEDGNDSINSGDGNDVVLGGAGSDQLGGGTGNDDLQGGIGNDTIWGEDGDDFLTGGAGDDVLIGDTFGGPFTGSGIDLFSFAPGDGNDTIADFTPGTDHIRFAGTDLLSFADVQSHAVFVHAPGSLTGNTVITYDGINSVTLNFIVPGQISAADFSFA